MKRDDRVVTPAGPGTIIGIDLPDSRRARRYVVRLDGAEDWEEGFNFDPCYFESELRSE
jgi:hypothetical protein